VLVPVDAGVQRQLQVPGPAQVGGHGDAPFVRRLNDGSHLIQGECGQAAGTGFETDLHQVRPRSSSLRIFSRASSAESTASAGKFWGTRG